MGSIGEWNWAIAVASARYNTRIIESIFLEWPRNQPNSLPLHEVIFCAANLAFATELYLKAACVACSGNPPPRSHRLLTIFQNLPKTDRYQICSRYDELYSSKFGQLANGEIWLRLSDDILPSDKRPTSLTEVLGHYSSSYEDWRYVFAIHKSANPSNLRCLHYSRLMCLCVAIDKHLQRKFPAFVRDNEISILQNGASE